VFVFHEQSTDEATALEMEMVSDKKTEVVVVMRHEVDTQCKLAGHWQAME
jgi:hypothetical protein